MWTRLSICVILDVILSLSHTHSCSHAHTRLFFAYVFESMRALIILCPCLSCSYFFSLFLFLYLYVSLSLSLWVRFSGFLALFRLSRIICMCMNICPNVDEPRAMCWKMGKCWQTLGQYGERMYRTYTHTNSREDQGLLIFIKIVFFIFKLIFPPFRFIQK